MGRLFLGFAFLTVVTVGQDEELAKKDIERLRGDWEVLKIVDEGMLVALEGTRHPQVSFQGNSVVLDKTGFFDRTDSFQLSPKANPKAIDITVGAGDKKGKKVYGIYLLEGDNLKLCFGSPVEKPRPTEFDTKEKSNTVLMVLRRIKKKETNK